MLACRLLQSSDKLSNNSKRSCEVVVTYLTHYVIFRLKLTLYVVLNEFLLLVLLLLFTGAYAPCSLLVVRI